MTRAALIMARSMIAKAAVMNSWRKVLLASMLLSSLGMDREEKKQSPSYYKKCAEEARQQLQPAHWGPSPSIETPVHFAASQVRKKQQ